MPRLAERQRAFSLALLDPDREIPSGLVDPTGTAAPKRFGVYRNNVAVALIEALRANFPATCRIVGEDFFSAMARLYAAQHPPSSPVLLDYGASFPDFVADFTPARSLPYLSGVARLERAWTEIYHALDAAPIDAGELHAIAPERSSALTFAVHPALRIVRSRFPVLTIWRMNVGDGIPGPVDMDAGGEDALILRAHSDVEVRSMPDGAAEFVAAIARGCTLAQATEFAFEAAPSFDLAVNLAALLDAGAFVEFNLAKCHPGAELAP